MTKIYPILDATTLERRGCTMSTAARAFLSVGAQMIQIRQKGHWSREFYHEAEEVASLCAQYSAQLIVNDRADFALLLDAGLHVGQDDLPASLARGLIGNSRVLGFSTHNVDQLIDATNEPIDYVALGPIFATQSKERADPPVGLDNLYTWRGFAPKHPLVAIGGITRANAQRVLDAGADYVAVIGDLLPDLCTPLTLSRRFEQWLQLVSR